MKRRERKEKKQKKRCRPVEITSCTSLLLYGRSFSLSSHRQVKKWQKTNCYTYTECPTGKLTKLDQQSAQLLKNMGCLSECLVYEVDAVLKESIFPFHISCGTQQTIAIQLARSYEFRSFLRDFRLLEEKFVFEIPQEKQYYVIIFIRDPSLAQNRSDFRDFCLGVRLQIFLSHPVRHLSRLAHVYHVFGSDGRFDRCDCRSRYAYRLCYKHQRVGHCNHHTRFRDERARQSE